MFSFSYVVDEESLIICRLRLLTSRKAFFRLDQRDDKELISHSEHNKSSRANAESMFVLAFNIRASILTTNRKSRRNASNSMMIKMVKKCYARRGRMRRPVQHLYTLFTTTTAAAADVLCTTPRLDLSLFVIFYVILLDLFFFVYRLEKQFIQCEASTKEKSPAKNIIQVCVSIIVSAPRARSWSERFALSWEFQFHSCWP